MASLFQSLAAAGSSLGVFQRALEVTQNNITNASTPGYARQRMLFEAAAFSPSGGLAGGVLDAGIQSTRDVYADHAVRYRMTGLAQADRAAASLSAIEGLFDVTGESGIPKALTDLVSRFSSWSVNPSSPVLRQAVMQGAEQLASSFRQTAAGLNRARTDALGQIRQTAGRLNALASEIANLNGERLRTGSSDPALESNLATALEALASIADITVLAREDGSVQVMLGGTAALVVGDRAFSVSVDASGATGPEPLFPGAAAQARLVTAEGADVTDSVSGSGELGALLDFHNQVLPSLIGDAYQAGDLNRLAQAVAERVNELLAGGLVSEGPPPQSGVALFGYDSANPAAAAQTIVVQGAPDGSTLAAIEPGPPYVANGVALRLANLLSSSDPADRLDGNTYVQYYGSIAGSLGRSLESARDQQAVGTALVTQARALRDQLSGVSLDEEAILLLQFQRAYQATAQLISVLNDLTETTVNLVR